MKIEGEGLGRAWSSDAHYLETIYMKGLLRRRVERRNRKSMTKAKPLSRGWGRRNKTVGNRHRASEVE